MKTDYLEIDLDGKIEAVVERLRALAADYPGAEIEITTKQDSYDDYRSGIARLSFKRPLTAEEKEYAKYEALRREIAPMRAASESFKAEGVPYPRQKQLDKLEAKFAPLDEKHNPYRMWRSLYSSLFGEGASLISYGEKLMTLTGDIIAFEKDESSP